MNVHVHQRPNFFGFGPIFAKLWRIDARILSTTVNQRVFISCNFPLFFVQARIMPVYNWHLIMNVNSIISAIVINTGSWTVPDFIELWVFFLCHNQTNRQYIFSLWIVKRFPQNRCIFTSPATRSKVVAQVYSKFARFSRCFRNNFTIIFPSMLGTPCLVT